MGGCACYGVKMVVVGALLAVNDLGMIWKPVSPWLLIGAVLVVLGALKIVMPVCPVHGKQSMSAPAKGGKRR
ncbi:hypothetical protein HYU12_02590 [Candidatus Woesearchaeota archaeon]|nr:hypothetical protein [Candidatus Woesearchaeota archaeon]